MSLWAASVAVFRSSKDDKCQLLSHAVFEEQPSEGPLYFETRPSSNAYNSALDYTAGAEGWRAGRCGRSDLSVGTQ